MVQDQPNRIAESSPPKETFRTVLSFLIMSAWLVFGVYISAKAVRAKYWPTTTGTIVSAAQVTKSAGKGFSHGVEFDYIYRVGPQEYRSKHYKAIDDTFGTPEWRKAVSQYQADTRLTVHYDPKDPKDSAIDPGLTFFNFMMTGLPLAFLVLIVSVTIKNMKKEGRGTTAR